MKADSINNNPLIWNRPTTLAPAVQKTVAEVALPGESVTLTGGPTHKPEVQAVAEQVVVAEPKAPEKAPEAPPQQAPAPTFGSILMESPIVTGGLPFGPGLEFQVLLGSFLQKPEVVAAAQNGTAGKNLGKMMDYLSLHLSQNLGIQSGNVYTAGDTEGRTRNDFETLKEQGMINKGLDGVMRFRDADSSFLFMGDLGDRGPAALKTAREMLSLHESSPGRVAFIWGNRDLGKLAIHNDLPELKALGGQPGKLYREWLEKKLPEGGGDIKKLNTDANQVQFWLEQHSAPQALEFHRQGLEAESGKSVDLDEAARDYVQSWKPGGVFFEFLKAGSFAAPPELMGDSHMAFHGGAARENITSIPGEADLPGNLNDVIHGQFALGKRLIAEAESDINNGKQVKSMLLSLGDSKWMASAGINAARAESFIYSERNTEDGNLRGHETEVAQAMQKVGKQTELVGHTPIGPVPEMRLSPEGTAKVYTDTSMAHDGSQAMLARKGDLTISVGRVGDQETGQVVFFAHKPGADTQFGKITADGFGVVGMTLDGNFLLSKYEPGFKLAQKTVSPQQLKELNPQAQRPDDSHARLSTQQQISAAIENKMSAWQTPILSFDKLDQIREQRTPVVISAASSYGRHPATQDQLAEMAHGLKDAFAGNIMVIDGGTSVRGKDGEKAPELLVQEIVFGSEGPPLAGTVEPKRVAAMPSVPNLDEVTIRPDAMVVAGGAEDWHVPVVEASRYAGQNNGCAVFIGGGGAVAKAIEAARKQPETPVFLVAGRGKDPMGASDKVSREENLPAHFHVIYNDELGQLGSRIQALVGAAKVEDAPPTEKAPERVGVFITSANPPHIGHKALVEAIKEKHNLDRVVVCADTSAAYKKLAPQELRDEMLTELFKDSPGIDYYNAEMAANGNVKTGEMWDVMEGVRSTFPGAQLFNICGNDTLEWLKTLPEEKRGGDITFLVNDRDGAEIPGQIGAQKVERFRDDSAVPPGLSSTKVKQLIAAGEQPETIPSGVWTVIQKHNLYRG